MALQFSGSGGYLSTASALVSTTPLTFACWYKPASMGTQSLVSIGSTATADYFTMFLSSAKMTAQVGTNGAGSQHASSAASLVAGNWYHCVAVFTSATSRTVYLNNVSALNTSSRVPGTLNITTIGSLFAGSGASNLTNGVISYPTIWNIALSATDVTNLYNGGAGVKPDTIQSGNVVSFSLLQEFAPPYFDTGQSANWTLTGTPTLIDDPFNASRQLAGTCQSAATNTGDLTVGTAGVPLSGTSTGHATNTGALVASKFLTGTCAARCANTGLLRASKVLAGTSTARATDTGLLRASKPLAGQNTARATNTGTLLVSKLLAGVGAGHSLNVGTLNVGNNKSLSGTSSARATSVGTLASGRLFTATCLARAACSGALVSRRALIGTALSHSNSSGLLRASRQFSGTSQARSNNRGALLSVHLGGPCPGMKSTVRVLDPRTGTVILVA